jgi:pyruvate/2-oxoacid:ferredoxin oxidoreductase alpha subunit
MREHLAIDGNTAVATAMRQINPDVVAAYPITRRPPPFRPFPNT